MRICEVIWIMPNKKSEDSRHYAQIWDRVIKPVFRVVYEECDEEFRQTCDLETNYAVGWKKQLEMEYRKQRKSLKEVCYHDSVDKALLDGRKLAAVICKALIREKGFKFNSSQALTLMQAKKEKLSPVDFNCWTAQNVFINYKLAYYASLQLVYLTLLHDLQSSEDEKRLAVLLNRKGHLCPYPSSPNADSFDVNIIIGMARADLAGKDFDMFFFAMQLYQLEVYTVEMLKREATSEQQEIVTEQVTKYLEKKAPEVAPQDFWTRYGKHSIEALHTKISPLYSSRLTLDFSKMKTPDSKWRISSSDAISSLSIKKFSKVMMRVAMVDTEGDTPTVILYYENPEKSTDGSAQQQKGLPAHK